LRTRKHEKHIRLSDAEHATLRSNASRTGLSDEAFIRQLITGYVPKEQPPADYYGMMRELNAIGNRMNQIAARANATGFFLADEYAKNVRELNQSILGIQAAVTLPERRKA